MPHLGVYPVPPLPQVLEHEAVRSPRTPRGGPVGPSVATMLNTAVPLRVPGQLVPPETQDCDVMRDHFNGLAHDYQSLVEELEESKKSERTSAQKLQKLLHQTSPTDLGDKELPQNVPLAQVEAKVESRLKTNAMMLKRYQGMVHMLTTRAKICKRAHDAYASQMREEYLEALGAQLDLILQEPLPSEDMDEDDLMGGVDPGGLLDELFGEGFVMHLDDDIFQPDNVTEAESWCEQLLAECKFEKLQLLTGTLSFMNTQVQGCSRREGAQRRPQRRLDKGFGRGCQSGWGRLLAVTNAIAARHLPSGRQ